MRNPEYLLKSLALVLLALTVLFSVLPWEVAWIDMIFIVFMVGLLAIIIPKERKQFTRWAMVFATIYWFSKLIPGKLGAILSVSGVGFAVIFAVCLVNKREANSS